MKLLNFLIIKLTICLVVGILFGFYFPVSAMILIKIVLVGILLFFVTYILAVNKPKQKVYLALITYGLSIVIGVLLITFHTHENQLKHYSSQLHTDGHASVKISIYKKLKPNSFYNKFLAKVVSINSDKATGIVLVNVDSTRQLAIDDVLYVKTALEEIKKPLNPHQFDFKAYMYKQQVYHQLFLNEKNSLKLTSQQTLYGVAANIRERINNTLVKYSISKENLSIINALLLGQRQDISKDTYKSFTKSGAIHILAISGLHIGLLMLLLGIVFKPLAYFKTGKKLIPILIIILLWIYAFITGMSASVMRAVTMFSLVTVAIYSNRVTNTYNTLVISAFLLLLFNPFYIFDVGFQLSYSAVFGIVWIKPLFDTIWKPKYYLVRKLWDVFTVTLAAQFGILPLSLFYFHQFPGLFFISNMVIIPLLGILLGIGILTIVFAYFGWIPNLLFDTFEICIGSLVSFVQFISSKEAFVFTEIPFNGLSLVSWYVFIVSLILLWKTYSYKRLLFALFSIICVQFAYLYNKQDSQSSEFVVFNQYKTTLIAKKNGNQLNYATKNLRYLQSLDNYIVNEFINRTQHDSLKNVYVFKNHKILIVDDDAVYDSSFKPEIVLLTSSPKINLNRLITTLKPKLIVVDNNNYKSYAERWKTTCLNNDINFYNIREDGAFVLK
jgi:competence protein ComEC